MTTFGEALKEARKSKKMTQKDLAALLGKTGNSVCEWEKGRSSPSAEDLEKICQILNVSASSLIGGRKPGLNEEEQRLLAQFRFMTREQKDLILKLSEQMMGTE